ncbi:MULTISPECIES: reverse transcriptase domain-containing protein [Photorhabdus]|uniref:Reverse transcriptase domain-containing protein n=1 Tax=Photorhabdus bodei TaxID=2029681 RepID=A0AAW6BCQ2_9GAMM|nr:MULTISPECIES: reverse transcriptase domain-containing protein [Photorhabdus]MBS9424123.1 RNA-dependent DNA polymerase [Photorhabdus caribbeanensis]MCC8465329.1 RNA-dependent DNA polymerase [Photorhabdus bodei]MDB6370829.1 reverse transcriptase domain-containing protein [Photorhabdus bodei]PQQ32995.1 RNA-dependent DNA polymerase [Photorhabdus luminescens]
MKVQKQFAKHFSEKNLKQLFEDYVFYSGATGIDNLDPVTFKEQLNEQIKIISRKALSGSYQFTKYKLKLVSKGRGKAPREISIPTVRDRIALRALNDFLSERFAPSLNIELPQNVVKKVKNTLLSDKYSGYIKLDVSNFYPSIKHDEMLSRLRKRIKDENIFSIIESAISSPTMGTPTESYEISDIGVPQGLAVSNVLSSIYMINIDNNLNKIPDIIYFRYVDDILIFCDYSNAQSIADNIIARFRKIGLKIHDPKTSPDKSSINRAGTPFSYLGYHFEKNTVSARKATVEKLKNSLSAIFTAYKYSKSKSEEFLLWRLNLRITGCVFENKSKGWLFFFAEINDEKLLHELDHYVRKLIKRFKVSIKPKRFSRTFKEMSHNRYETKYIPNFNNYGATEKLALLEKYFPNDVKDKTLTQAQIDYFFHKRIGRQVKDLLEDVKDFRS